MTTVFERVLLSCSYTAARRRASCERLRAALAIDGFTFSLERSPDPLRFDERFHVEWMPKGNAPLPHFTGELVLCAHAAGGAIPALELSGEYAPPLGHVGRAFDLIIGSRVAAATARALLRQLAQAIETAA